MSAGGAVGSGALLDGVGRAWGGSCDCQVRCVVVSVVPAVLQPHARSLGFSEGCVVHERCSLFL